MPPDRRGASPPTTLALDPAEISRAVGLALAEDLGPGDVTSEALIPSEATITLAMAARAPLVVAGLPLAVAVFERTAPGCRIERKAKDGDEAAEGAVLAAIEGQARGLFAGERAALNFVQHLSGIATLTRAFLDRIEATGAILLDTRKTVPTLRVLAKYASAAGGARNHRMGLYDGVLIKDNHIAVCGGIREGVRRAKASGLKPVEVECDDLAQVEEALAAGADRILLDNMNIATLSEAVRLVNGRVPLEASGGVTLETVRAVAATGVDFISVGEITHSAPAVDIGLDVVKR